MVFSRTCVLAFLMHYTYYFLDCIISVVHGSCTHGTIRLVGGTTTNQGRVEVCVGQTWETVCDHGFYSSDARVVCHQLGYDVDKPGTCKLNKITELY